MQCYCGTDTTSMVDIHGLLETRGEARCHGGVSYYWLFAQAHHERRDTASVIWKLGSIAIIESLPEITEITQM